MKKKLTLMTVAGLLVIGMTIGGTLASLNTNTEGKAGTGVTQISTGQVGISIEQSGITGATFNGVTPTPGGAYAFDACVKNDLEGGYDIYAMVTIYKSWVDADDLSAEQVGIGFIVQDQAMEFVNYDSLEANEEGITLGGTFGDWIVVHQDDEQLVLIYTKPIQYGEYSTDFMNYVTFTSDMNNAYCDQNLELYVEINAVQVNTQEAAMQAEWGYFPLFTSDGTIVNVFKTEAERAAVTGVTKDSAENTENAGGEGNE